MSREMRREESWMGLACRTFPSDSVSGRGPSARYPRPERERGVEPRAVECRDREGAREGREVGKQVEKAANPQLARRREKVGEGRCWAGCRPGGKRNLSLGSQRPGSGRPMRASCAAARERPPLSLCSWGGAPSSDDFHCPERASLPRLGTESWEQRR